MRGPYKTCTSHELLHFLNQGDFSSFLSSLEYYDSSQPDWFRYKILALKVLAYNRSVHQTYELAELLSQSLTVSEERDLARAEYLYVSWLQFGRSQAALEELESLLERNWKTNSLSSFWEHIRLRTRSSKLMLGLTDANEKQELLKDYEALVKHFTAKSLFDEAFFAFKELIDVIQTKPFPQTSLALKTVNWFLEIYSSEDRHYQSGILFYMKAILTTEVSLSHGKPYDVSGYIHEAESKFKVAGNNVAKSHYLSDYGALLLKYGLSKGKKLLIKAVRQYQKSDKLDSATKPINTIISWQRVTGNHTELGSIQYLASRALGMNSSQTGASIENDLSIKLENGLRLLKEALKNLDLDRAEEILTHLEIQAEDIGHTYLSLKVRTMGLLFETQFGLGIDHEEVLNVAGSLQKMGYPQDALDFMANNIFHALESSNQRVSDDEFKEYLNFVNSLNAKAALEISLAESVGAFYEVLSLVCVKETKLMEALKLLRVANFVFSNHQMKPKVAVNLMCQAQVLRGLYTRLNYYDFKQKGLSALREAKELFQLMNFKEGFKKAITNQTHFQEKQPFITQIGFLSANSKDAQNNAKAAMNKAFEQGRNGLLYGLFSSFIEHQISDFSIFHSHSVNQN